MPEHVMENIRRRLGREGIEFQGGPACSRRWFGQGFPIVKRQSEGLALAYVCGRVLEAAVIIVGAISLLAVVSLRRSR